MSNKKPDNLYLNTSYRDIDLSANCNGLCQHYLSVMNSLRGLQGARGTKSVYLTEIEEEFIGSFCEANDTNISDLIRLGFWTDGAIPEELIIAISKTPKAVLTFLDLGKKTLNFKYLEKWKNYTVEDFEEALNKGGKTKSIRDRSLVIEETEKHRKKRGFPSWAYYAKRGMLDLGVYPHLAVEVAKSHLRVFNKKVNLTNAELKKKQHEKVVEVKKRKDSDPKLKIQSVKLALTAFFFEQDNFIQPFIDELRTKGLSLSTIVKYKLLEHNIIDESMLNMSLATKEKCKNFSYERPEPQGTELFYQNQKEADKEKKRHINNVSVLSKARDAIFAHDEIGRGRFPNWIRDNILEAYSVYPIATDTKTSIIEIFKSQ